MNLEELCKKYYYSESTVLNAFPQVQRNVLKKHGVLLEKQGRGKKAIYIKKEKLKMDSYIPKKLEKTKEEHTTLI